MEASTVTATTASPTTTTTTSRSTCSVLSSSRSSRKISNSRSKDQVRSRLLNNLGIFNGAVDNAPNPAIARKIKIIRAMGLGGVIPPKPPSQTSSSHHQNMMIDNENIRPKINFSQITHEPLKYRKEDDDMMDVDDYEEDGAAGGGGGGNSESASGRGSNGTASLENTLPSTSASTTNNNHQHKQPPKTNNNNNHLKKPRRRKICFNDSVKVAHIPMRSEYSERVRSRMWSNRYEIHENATRNAIEFQAEGWDWRTVTEDEGMFIDTSSGELIHPVHCQQ